MQNLHRRLLIMSGRELHTPWLDLDLAGSSQAVAVLRDQIRDAAHQREHVLLWGPAGLAKFRLARLIHLFSENSDQLLATFDPRRFGEEDCHLHLFGSNKPGDGILKQGVTDRAAGGSLLIEEVGALPPSCQRVLALNWERSLRLLCTLVQDPAEAVSAGRLDPDFLKLFRNRVYQVPTLEERREDIPALFRAYLRHFSERHGRRLHEIDPEVENFLLRHPWPGQLRELRMAVELAVLRAEGQRMRLADFAVCGMDEQTLPLEYKRAKKIVELDFKRRFLSRLLRLHQGRVGRAAEQAGLPRPSFSNMLREVGLVAADFKAEARRRSASKS